MGETETNQCWWCHSGERQSSYRLFFKCRRWAPERREVGKACEWKHPRAPSVRFLLQNDKAIPAVLNFLRKTQVGKVVNLTTRVEEVGDVGEEGGVVLRPQEGGGGGG